MDFEIRLAAAILAAEFVGLSVAAAVCEWKEMRWRKSSADRIVENLRSLPSATNEAWFSASVHAAPTWSGESAEPCTCGPAAWRFCRWVGRDEDIVALMFKGSEPRRVESAPSMFGWVAKTLWGECDE